ncbi:hypothetical protein CANCADRAFT_55375 [Tortispora caseinolytica NRRL Y-17796]|uniref:BHLH domain-containing protein n=1 Tax=Tortispora caseinolytica NRRL Y-17796 TaxID=767744 RepID=A0A1E4TIE4_9ASCO|nr:hypothetical protein CANCADRAFT_55375 [Tortispora caseinolytica NRRL Y-17796]
MSIASIEQSQGVQSSLVLRAPWNSEQLSMSQPPFGGLHQNNQQSRQQNYSQDQKHYLDHPQPNSSSGSAAGPSVFAPPTTVYANNPQQHNFRPSTSMTSYDDQQSRPMGDGAAPNYAGHAIASHGPSTSPYSNSNVAYIGVRYEEPAPGYRGAGLPGTPATAIRPGQHSWPEYSGNQYRPWTEASGITANQDIGYSTRGEVAAEYGYQHHNVPHSVPHSGTEQARVSAYEGPASSTLAGGSYYDSRIYQPTVYGRPGTGATPSISTHPVTSLSVDQHKHQEASETHSRTYSRSPALRQNHKIAERRRRRDMADLYARLRELLPNNQGPKNSKHEILQLAVNYLSDLRDAGYPVSVHPHGKEEKQQMAGETDESRHHQSRNSKQQDSEHEYESTYNSVTDAPIPAPSLSGSLKPP